MATSREVYNRIRWDARFDRGRFTIGYLERHEGHLVELPFDEWDGTIPWHRVHYFAQDGVRVWDRSGLDRVSSGELVEDDGFTSEAEQAFPRDGGFEPAPVFRFVGGEWRLLDEGGSLGRSLGSNGALRVLTWNVLAERDDAPVETRLAGRLGRLLATLREADADVLALEEATPALLEALLAETWVRARYATSDATGETLRTHRHGPLLLARAGFELRARTFSNGKRALVGRFVVGGAPLDVAVLHLTSDLARDFEAKRARELAAVLDALKGSRRALMVGDFNTSVEDPGLVSRAGFVDAWRSLHGTAGGATFDPDKNALAALVTVRGLAFRLDRVLLRARDLEPVAIELVGGEGEAAASDHAGLLATFGPLETHEAAPVTTSALAVVLPEGTDARAIDALRAEHDPAFDRWPPHVTLLFGFVPEERFAEAAALVARAVADEEPFTLRLERFGHFEHGDASVHLVAESDGAIERIAERLAARFPACARKRPFVAHLTIARFETAALARDYVEFPPRFWPLEVPISSLVLLARRGESRFEVKREVPLGRSLEAWLVRRGEVEPPAATERRAKVRADLEALLRAKGGAAADAAVHLAGSTRLGVARPSSDLDLVVSSRALDLEGLAAIVEAAGTKVERVTGALFPLIRFVQGGLTVEAHVDETLDALPARCREIDRLLDLAHDRVTVTTFRTVLRTVRAWARARGLDAQAWGYPANAAWALLVGWAVQGAPRDEAAGPLLRHVFERAAVHPWPEPVRPEPGSEAADGFEPRPRDRFPVLGLVEPIVNVARTVTPGTRAVLVAELRRAASVVGRILAGEVAWEELVREPEPSAGAHVVELPRGAHERGAVRFVLELERARGVTGVRVVPRPGGPVRVFFSGPREALEKPLARLASGR